MTGSPIVYHVEKVCDECTLGKHHRDPFPKQSSYHAEKGLELVHTNLCGQITPPTPSGKSYFLLVVDYYSRFMRVEMLKTNDEAMYY